MATRVTVGHDMERLMRVFKEQTGKEEVEIGELAQFALDRGYTAPEPETPLSMLTKQFARRMRAVSRVDEVTGNPYRAFHHVEERYGQQVLNLWRDINDAPRNFMVKSIDLRSGQVLGDVLQMTFDTDHWNRINPDEEPVEAPTDYTFRVQVRKNAPKMINED